MESLTRRIERYEEYRKNELIPILEALIKEATELGLEFDFTCKGWDGKDREYQFSKDGIHTVDDMRGYVLTSYFVDIVTRNRKDLHRFYKILLRAQTEYQRLTGKYIPEDLK